MELKYPVWQEYYEALLLEFVPERIAALVAAVEAAMFRRMRELHASPDGDEERQAMLDAAKTLLAIQREILGFPGLAFIDQKEARAEFEPD